MDKPICNFCRLEDNPNNLLTPCGCKGTSGGYVHFQCLKTWIETNVSDVCKTCKCTYKGLIIDKKPGRFSKFFYESDSGILFSYYSFTFFILFFLSHFAQFHSRLIHTKGKTTSAMFITVFNAFYLFLIVITFNLFLINLLATFKDWRWTHFDYIRVYEIPR